MMDVIYKVEIYTKKIQKHCMSFRKKIRVTKHFLLVLFCNAQNFKTTVTLE